MYQNYQYMPQRQEVIKVNGRAGAEMYQLAPNSSVFLLDEATENVVWFKMTDGAGYATLKPFSLVPYEEPKQIDARELEERIARLEEALNDKSDNITVESAKHTTRNKQG